MLDHRSLLGGFVVAVVIVVVIVVALFWITPDDFEDSWRDHDHRGDGQ